MKKVRFRMHRGGLLESLATTVSVESLDDVLKVVEELQPFSVFYNPNKCRKLSCEFYCNDDRINWETWAIKDGNGHIIGFSDGPLQWVDKEVKLAIKEIYKDSHGTLYWKYENVDDVNKRKKSQWISVDEKLPQDGDYVLARNNKKNWIDVNNPEGPRFDVVRFEKGLSEYDRKILKTGTEDDKKKANIFSSCDEHSNNKRPYCWHTFGPMKYFGQDITHWMPIPEFEQ